MSGDGPELPDEVKAHVFAEPWQAEAFALAVALNQRQTFDWREWVDVFSGQPAEGMDGDEQAIETAYYHRWLAALETIAVQHGLVSTPEVETRVEQWRRAYLRTPHGQPIELASGLEMETVADTRDHHDHDHHHHVHDDHHVRPAPIFVSPPIGLRQDR